MPSYCRQSVCYWAVHSSADGALRPTTLCLYVRSSHVMQRLAVKRLTDVGIGVLTPLAEQLANPLPHAMALATLDEIISGAHENLPAGSR